MTLLDLSRVTDALATLIQQSVGASRAWAPNLPPAVEIIPPEAMAGEGIGLHLYAVGHNDVAPSLPQSPVADALGLDLHYQLTAHGSANPATSASVRREQLLLGLAMKALHDHSILKAGLTVAGVDVFDTVGLSADNSLTISLSRLDPEQAVSWWMASTASVRAAAYYRVSIAFIQEDPPELSGPPVLTREVFGFAGLAPHVGSTRSRHLITRPGHTPQSVVNSPATVEPGGSFELVGYGFGPAPVVSVECDRWARPEPLSGITTRIIGGSETILASLDTRLAALTVTPGLYRVEVTRTEERSTTTGEPATFAHRSNLAAITVVPRIEDVDPPDVDSPDDPVVLTGGPFAPADSVRLLIDGDELVPSPGSPEPGRFRVTDSNTIRFRPPAPRPSGVLVRVRVMVDGAENLPYWYRSP